MSAAANKKVLGTVPSLVSSASLFRSPATQVIPLANGLRLATQTFDSPTATVAIRVDSGSSDDVKSGTASLLNRLSRRKIESQLAASGVKLNSYTCREHTVYSARVFKSDVNSVFATISDAVSNPALDAQSVEAEKACLAAQAAGLEKNYQDRLMYHLHRTAFMDTGLGNFPEGTPEGIKSITVGDLEAYRNAHVTGKNTVAVGAGGVDQDVLLESVSKSLGSLSSSVAARSSPAVFVGSDIEFRFDSMKEATIAMAYEAPAANSDEAFTFKVLEAVLGSWKLTQPGAENAASRFAQDVYESHSASSFETFSLGYKDSGLFGIKITADPHYLEEAMYRVTYNFTRLAYEVSETEVERAKNQIKTKLLLNSANSDHVVSDIAWQLQNYGRRIPSAEVAARIDAVTLQDVRAAAHKYIVDEDHALAAVGPVNELPDYNWIRRRSYWHRF